MLSPSGAPSEQPVVTPQRAHVKPNQTKPPTQAYVKPNQTKPPTQAYVKSNKTKQPTQAHVKANQTKQRLQVQAARQAAGLYPPFDGATGRWELHSNCDTSMKSFSYFECACGKRWVSAHGFARFRQGCKQCDTETFPKFMWINADTKHKTPTTTEEDGPHDQQRCEACRSGQCKQCQL